MSNLTPVSSFDDVYQIEQTDLVLGGAGNVANQQAQDLTNRTKYLKDHSQKIFKSGALTVDLTTTNTAVKLFSYKYKVTANHLSDQRLNKALRFDVHYGCTADIYMSVMREFELNFMADKFFLKLSKLVSDFDDELNTTDNSPLDIYLIVRRRDDADTYTYFDFYLDDTKITETRTKDIEVVVYEPVDSTLEDKIIFESSLTAIAKMSNVSSSTVVQTSIHSTVESLASDNIFSSIVSTLGEINQTPSSATPESIINESRFSQMTTDIQALINGTFRQWNFVMPGTFTWTCPAGITKIKVMAIGAGGNGGEYNSSSAAGSASGGGGGGVCIDDDYDVIPGTNYTVIVANRGDELYSKFSTDIIANSGTNGNNTGVVAPGGSYSGGSFGMNGGDGASGADYTYANGRAGACGGGGASYFDGTSEHYGGSGGTGLYGGGGGGGSSQTAPATGGASIRYGGHGGYGAANESNSYSAAGDPGYRGIFGGGLGLENDVVALSGFRSGGGGGGYGGGGGGTTIGNVGARKGYGYGASGCVIIRVGGDNFEY